MLLPHVVIQTAFYKVLYGRLLNSITLSIFKDHIFYVPLDIQLNISQLIRTLFWYKFLPWYSCFSIWYHYLAKAISTYVIRSYELQISLGKDTFTLTYAHFAKAKRNRILHLQVWQICVPCDKNTKVAYVNILPCVLQNPFLNHIFSPF